LVTDKVRPHLVSIWLNNKAIAAEPRKIFYVLAGSTLAQPVVVFALGASRHAVGQRASIATLICVITLASIVAARSRCRVIEAGLSAARPRWRARPRPLPH
jgi:hypothetical protein